jgi:hypothetical protein
VVGPSDLLRTTRSTTTATITTPTTTTPTTTTTTTRSGSATWLADPPPQRKTKKQNQQQQTQEYLLYSKGKHTFREAFCNISQTAVRRFTNSATHYVFHTGGRLILTDIYGDYWHTPVTHSSVPVM